MEMPNEKLESAVQRLNIYRGLASPVYIAASFLQNLENGPDPVYCACMRLEQRALRQGQAGIRIQLSIQRIER